MAELDQPAQGSTADYCSAWPSDVPEQGRHHLITHMHGGALVSVQRCQFCGWIDFADLDAQVCELVAEGRRQATEGWECEWAWTGPGEGDDGPCWCNSEASARHFAEREPGRTVVSRLVGPWEPAEQAEPVKTWAPGYSPAEKLASLRAHPHGSACICDDCTNREPWEAAR